METPSSVVHCTIAVCEATSFSRQGGNTHTNMNFNLTPCLF